MRRPWTRLLRLGIRDAATDTDDELGEPGPGKVLVVTSRDYLGRPEEWVWVDESVAWQYDDARWRNNPCP